MRISVIGSDGRYACLRRLLEKYGLTDNYHESDLIITPWPAPIDLPESAVVVTCGPKNGPDGSVDLLLDEEYQRDIAWMTAEGAISAVMNSAKFALRGAECAVAGWGRIGKELTALLVGLGAKVTVISRRDSVCGEVHAYGAGFAGIYEIDNALRGMRFVFSTSPVMMIDSAVLAVMDKDAMIIDLASAPYGVDIEATEELGMKAWREPGLPGRYCPENAGRAIFDALLRHGFLKEV